MIVPIANKVGIVSTRIDTCRSSLFCSKNSSVSLHPTNVADRVLMDIQNSGIIACLRAKSAELAVEAARAALRGGISVLEITMSTPGVFEALQCLVQEYPSASIGVGTVLDRRVAKEAVHIGAKFLMSPAMVKGILSDVAEGQALYIPGAATPTEVLSASTDGAKLIKVYPVSVLGGVEYLAALKKPFPHIPLVASQGMRLDSVGAYICEGASAVVLSDAIFDKKAMAERNFLRIHHLACSAATKGNQAVRKIKCMDE
ncbi:KHG/KDPG aldolase-like isoform X1 [Salvia hispanica]|uniref:KHG/KDPG aldolase-like isoform X1 n=1 Tax=Salvia hispanica TaxID=49212 RepID=UPI00200975E9|nr:KHG/KDPG aldolase-like isoform X1 [Salvia hispanica]